ncbi:hypothetical protein MFLAVUS_003727 [Mucor flavus]|uniref:Uncharacterized protein n=1 Tax=Mucor flavus TaxID=439312 RepID=A0ABP9YTY5_9FUNG
MNVLQNRIDSFNNNVVEWPHTTNPGYAEVKSFAKAGFYLVHNPNSPDTVRCFICNIELNHWQPMVSPYIRHDIESPNCAWKRLSHPDAHKRPSLSDPSKACDHPRSAKMHSARLATFNCQKYWPPQRDTAKYPSAVKLSRAGFYFSPTVTEPTKVQCVYCGNSVSVTSNDVDFFTGRVEYITLITKKKYANHDRRSAIKRRAVDISSSAEKSEIKPVAEKQKKEETEPSRLTRITASSGRLKPVTKRKREEKTAPLGPTFGMTPWDEKDAPPPRKRVRFEITVGQENEPQVERASAVHQVSLSYYRQRAQIPSED